jgi:hypothetical protein
MEPIGLGADLDSDSFAATPGRHQLLMFGAVDWSGNRRCSSKTR